MLDYRFLGGRPAAFVTMDVTAVAARVRAALAHRASGEDSDESAT